MPAISDTHAWILGSLLKNDLLKNSMIDDKVIRQADISSRAYKIYDIYKLNSSISIFE